MRFGWRTWLVAALLVPLFAYVVGAAVGRPAPDSPPQDPVIVDDSPRHGDNAKKRGSSEKPGPREDSKGSGRPHQTSPPDDDDDDDGRDDDDDVKVVKPSPREIDDDDSDDHDDDGEHDDDEDEWDD